MRLFIKKVCAFLILLFCFIAFADCWLRNANTTTKVKYDGLNQAKDSVEVIVLGNSHACYGVDPSSFNRKYTYNLANYSQNIILDAGILGKAIENGLPKLQYVLISVDHHSLYSSTDDGISPMKTYYSSGVKLNDKSMLYYLLCDISPMLFGYQSQASMLLFRNLIRYVKAENNEIIDMENDIDMNDIYRGFAAFKKVSRESFNSNSYKSRAMSLNRDTLNEEILVNLENLINMLIEKDIVPILFTSPTYYEYNAFLSKNQRQQTRCEIDRLCVKYDLQYLDYEDDTRFVMDDFRNCDHLNYIGAQKFSRMLADTLAF